MVSIRLSSWLPDNETQQVEGNFNLQLQSGSTFVFAAIALRYIIRAVTPLRQTKSEISLDAESDFNFSSRGNVFRIILIMSTTEVALLVSTSVRWNLPKHDCVRAFLMVAFAVFFERQQFYGKTGSTLNTHLKPNYMKL